VGARPLTAGRACGRAAGAAAVAALLAAAIHGAAHGAPLRTPGPGIGVYRGLAVQGRLTAGEERSDDGARLAEEAAAVEVRYAPARRLSVGAVVPVVRRTAESPAGAETRRSGIGDVRLDAKYRFYRALGAWRDRQASVRFGVELPTGEGVGPAGLDGLPLAMGAAVQTGSDSVDLFGALSYQQSRGRFVQAASLGYQRAGEGNHYRFGDEVRLDLDAEAIVLPLRYTTPGNELFALLEASAVHRGADTFHGREVPGTGRTEVLLAPGLEYVATEQLALGVSVAFPVLTRADRDAMTTRRHVLVEARYAF
jgi:hypothetical protein